MNSRYSVRAILGTRLVLSVVGFSALVLFGWLGMTMAQQRAVRYPQGSVAGIDLSIDGPASVFRGQRAGWSVSSFVIRGLSQLDRLPNARLFVSVDGSDEEEAFATDGEGRGTFFVNVPDEQSASLQVHVRLEGAALRRDFDLPVEVQPNCQVSMLSLFDEVTRKVYVMGRFVSPASMRPISNHPSELLIQLGERTHRAEISTGANGEFLSELSLDSGDAPPSVTSLGRDNLGCVGASSPIGGQSPADFRVQTRWLDQHGAPQSVLAPNQDALLEVLVNDRNGGPLRNVSLRLPSYPRPEPDADRPYLTDERGRAQIPFHTHSISTTFADEQVALQASWADRAVQQNVPLRIVRQAMFASLEAEGGALSPSLGGAIWVTLKDALGRPLPNVSLGLTGPRVRPQVVTTDDAGLGRISVDALGSATDEDSECGSASLTPVVLTGPGAFRHETCLPVSGLDVLRIRSAEVTGDQLNISLARTLRPSFAGVRYRLLHQNQSVVQEGYLSWSGRGWTSGSPSVSGSGGHSAAAWSTVAISLSESAASLSRLRIVLRPILASGLELRGVVRDLEITPARSTEGLLEIETSTAHPWLTAVTAFAGPSVDTPLSRQFALQGANSADDGPAYAFVAGQVMPVPLSGAVVLRDAQRERARFERGRMAAVFYAIEERIASWEGPDLTGLAVSGPRGYSFNGALLLELGAEALGGEPMTLADIQAADPNFTFDSAACRATRPKLLRVTQALRAFVQENNLTLGWARLGDPGSWISHLARQQLGSDDEGSLAESSYLDGWGRPFVVVRDPASASRRYPIVNGYGVRSVGPDGRVMTADDIVDVTARCLPGSGLYARSVGEDELLFRMNALPVSEASLAALGTLLDDTGAEPFSYDSEVMAETSAGASAALPSYMNESLELLPSPTRPVAAVLSTAPSPSHGRSRLALRSPQLRSHVHVSHGANGFSHQASLRWEGPRVFLAADFPRSILADTESAIPVAVVNASNEAQQVQLSTNWRGQARNVSLDVPPSLTVATELLLDAGSGTQASEQLAVELQSRDSQGGAVNGSLSFGIAVSEPAFPLRTFRQEWLEGETSLSISAASQEVRHRRALLIHPRMLVFAPEFEWLRQTDPAMVLWLSGRQQVITEGLLWERMLGAQQPNGRVLGVSELSTYFAATVWSQRLAISDSDVVRSARDRASAALMNLPVFQDANSASVFLMAAALDGELAVDESGMDLQPSGPLGPQALNLLRAGALEETGSFSEAALAAILLAVDSNDPLGRTLYQRAVAGFERTGGVSQTLETQLEALDRLDEASLPTLADLFLRAVATVLAMHQVDALDNRNRIFRALLDLFDHASYVAPEQRGIMSFWWLVTAANVYQDNDVQGQRLTCAGQDAQTDAWVVQTHCSDLSARGVGLVRVEAVRSPSEFLGAAYRGSDLPATLQVEQSMAAGPRSLATVVIRAQAAMLAPMLEFAVPPGAVWDEAAQTGLTNLGYRPERRSPGFIRVVLPSLAADEVVRVPMPYRWIVSRGRSAPRVMLSGGGNRYRIRATR